MRKTWDLVKAAAEQPPMGRGCIRAAVEAMRRGPVIAGTSHARPTGDFASSHPMGRGAIAAAAEAMRRK